MFDVYSAESNSPVNLCELIILKSLLNLSLVRLILFIGKFKPFVKTTHFFDRSTIAPFLSFLETILLFPANRLFRSLYTIWHNLSRASFPLIIIQVTSIPLGIP
jgi:hypothetical protein